MQSRRLTRVNELIQQTVSRLVLNLKDPRIGFVTITGADVSPDLSLARIFYSVLGSPEEKEATGQALESAKPHVRRELARLKNLKKVPGVIFIYDDGVARADRVFRLLNTLEKEEKPSDAENS